MSNALNRIAVEAALYATAETEEDLQRGDQVFKSGSNEILDILQATSSSPERRAEGMKIYLRCENDKHLNRLAVEEALHVATSNQRDNDAAYEVFQTGGSLADVLYRAQCPDSDSYLRAQAAYYAVSNVLADSARPTLKERLAHVGGLFHPRQFAPTQRRH